jgi:hypothetical protein
MLLLSVPVKGQGIPIMGECINTSYLRTYTEINISGSPLTIEVNNVPCPNGCDSNAGQYGADCIFTEDSVTCVDKQLTNFNLGGRSEFFGLLFALIGVGVIVDSIIRTGEKGNVWREVTEE